MRASNRQPANHCLAGAYNPATPSQNHVPGQRTPSSLSLGTTYALLFQTRLTACYRCALRRYSNRSSSSLPSCDLINPAHLSHAPPTSKSSQNATSTVNIVVQLQALIHRIVVPELTSCHRSRSLRKLPNPSRDCRLHDKLAQAPGIITGRGPRRLP